MVKRENIKKIYHPFKQWWLTLLLVTLVVTILSTWGVIRGSGDKHSTSSYYLNHYQVAAPKKINLVNLPSTGKPSKQRIAEVINRILNKHTTVTSGDLRGIIVDGQTQEVYWSQQENRLATPASTLKLLTAYAVAKTLDLNSRLTTPLYEGNNPQELVLVGQGDVTISATTSAAQDSYYLGAGRLASLVAAVKQTGKKYRKLVIDNSLYQGSRLAPGWYSADVAAGNVAPMSSLMLDGGRDTNLKTHYSHRTSNPATYLGMVLAERLGIPASQVTVSTEPVARGNKLAEIKSAILQSRLREMLLNSDNVLAESIGRELAIAKGKEPSFSGAVAAVQEVLRTEGLEVDNLLMRDVSGLSEYDKVTAQILEEVMYKIFNSEQQEKILLTMLPVAGVTGTLKSRFTEPTPLVAGKVAGKTGTLDQVSTLAGVMINKNKHPLIFALMLHDLDVVNEESLIDELTQAIWQA